MTFADLQLIPPLLRAVLEEGYETPTPIQRQAIPHVLAGRDLLGCAQTGTGKTAAFALPILQRLLEVPRGANPPGSGRRPIRCLILTPTRELASQIGDSFSAYGKFIPEHRVQGLPLKPLRHTVIFGGVGQNPQEQVLKAGVDIVVATPGRLLDLAQQGFVKLDRLEIFVLDEADRMLDMGFIHDVRRVLAMLPPRRQSLFFSATMPGEAKSLADAILRDPAEVAVAPPATTVELIEQRLFYVEKNDKRALLQHLLSTPEFTRALVFTRTKHGANKVVEQLAKVGIESAAIHGNKSQGARERALAGFKNGQVRVLVATDIAARGIDIDDISHVVNYELPNVPETYVHRIGRTARAGASGISCSFCDVEERDFLADIERLTRQRIPVIDDHPYRSTVPMSVRMPPAPQQRHRQGPPPRSREHTRHDRPASPGGHHHTVAGRTAAQPSAPRQGGSASSGHGGAPTAGGGAAPASRSRSFRPRRGR